MKVLFAVLISVYSLNLFAGNANSGCGVGSMLLTKNTTVSQSLALTTNVWFSSPISMTTGTSGCNTSSFVLNEKKEIFFAEANFQNLNIEMAQGNGEILKAFAEVLGCSSKGKEHFGSFTQKNYTKIFPSNQTGPVEMLNILKSEMKEDLVLKSECQPLA